jgi:uncharacterized repeat protein (TIGR01451 family)
VRLCGVVRHYRRNGANPSRDASAPSPSAFYRYTINNSITGAQLGEGFTNAQGCYDITAPELRTAAVHFRFYAFNRHGNHELEVMAPGVAGSYTSISNSFSIVGESCLLVDIEVLPTSRFSSHKAYWIKDDLELGYDYETVKVGGVGVFWPVSGTRSRYVQGGNVEITQTGADYQDVVLHEMGHNIMYDSGYQPSNINCPPQHTAQSLSNSICAWVEGWADFYALAVTNKSVFTNVNSLDFETPTWGTSGWANGDTVEGRIAGALWDIHDAVVDGTDRISDRQANGRLGFIGTVFFSDPINDQDMQPFRSFWDALTAYGLPADPPNGTLGALFQNTIDYGEITVTAPKAGETWIKGNTYNITWDTTSADPEVKIEISRNSGRDWDTIEGRTQNDRTFEWRAEGDDTCRAQIRITTKKSEQSNALRVFDISNGIFTVGTPAIKVNIPNGGERWFGTTQQTIRWGKIAQSGNVSISLSTDGGRTFPLAPNELQNISGMPDPTDPCMFSQTWTVPNNINSNQCRIKITSVIAPSIMDTSNNNFTIRPNTPLAVYFPSGGEVFQTGEQIMLEWNPGGLSGSVRIEVSRDGGTTYDSTPLFSNTANDGMESWTVTGPASNQCVIKITSGSTSQTSGIFRITEPPPSGSITVMMPNGGETWVVGTTQTITWTSSNITGNVKIELSRTGISGPFEPLFPDTENDGSQSWIVTGTGSTSNNCFVRICSLNTPSVCDLSNAAFTIQQPSSQITITFPNTASDGVQVGVDDARQYIRWTSPLDQNLLVNIYLSTDSGTTWINLFPNEQSRNNGVKRWIPTVDQIATRCRIRIEVANTPAIFDISDADFEVYRPVAVVLCPNGINPPDPPFPCKDPPYPNCDQFRWPIGSTQWVHWCWRALDQGNDVRIDLSSDGGQTWTNLVGFASNNTNWQWNRVSGPDSALCRIRVWLNKWSQQPIGPIYDDSDVNFIIGNPSITVASPNGGENWSVGSTQPVTWTQFGIIRDVKIELSTDGGTTFPVLLATSSDDGSENITVPNLPTTTARIRVTCAGNGAVFDVSNGHFTISQPPMADVTISKSGPASATCNTQLQYTLTASNVGNASAANVVVTDTLPAGLVNAQVSINGGTPTAYTGSVSLGTLAAGGSATITITTTVTATNGTLSNTASISTTSSESNTGDNTSTTVATTITCGSITVLVPNGNEVWPIGSTQTISWTSSGVTGNVKIELSRNGTAGPFEILFDNTPNDHSQSWTVTGPASTNCFVKISSLMVPSVSDVSNAAFTICQSPSITVKSPNGGESWPVGSLQTITWTSCGVSGTVKIELSRNGGSTWEVLFGSTVNDGSQPWAVTGSGVYNQGTTQARIRISSATTPSVSDTSDANFTLSSLSVRQPNGGERWTVGSLRPIYWSSFGVSGNVKIEVSRDSGSSYQTIFPNTPNDGIEAWTVTEPISPACRIRITSVDNPEFTDTSDNTFEITPPKTMRVITPNGGESWPVGSSQTIQWVSTGPIDSVDILLSRDNGTTWETLFTDVPNADGGSRSWTVTGDASPQCLIRVIEVIGPIPTPQISGTFDISDAPFTISESATINPSGEPTPRQASPPRPARGRTPSLPSTVGPQSRRDVGR